MTSIGFSRAAAHEIQQDLVHVSNIINASLEEIEGTARSYAAVAKREFKAAAIQAVQKINLKESEISAFAISYGNEVVNATESMMALDQNLAGQIHG
jgi:transcriptional regulator of heat shock response